MLRTTGRFRSGAITVALAALALSGCAVSVDPATSEPPVDVPTDAPAIDIDRTELQQQKDDYDEWMTNWYGSGCTAENAAESVCAMSLTVGQLHSSTTALLFSSAVAAGANDDQTVRVAEAASAAERVGIEWSDNGCPGETTGSCPQLATEFVDAQLALHDALLRWTR